MNRDNRPYSGPVEAVKPNPTATFGPPGEQSSGGVFFAELPWGATIGTFAKEPQWGESTFI